MLVSPRDYGISLEVKRVESTFYEINVIGVLGRGEKRHFEQAATADVVISLGNNKMGVNFGDRNGETVNVAVSPYF